MPGKDAGSEGPPVSKSGRETVWKTPPSREKPREASGKPGNEISRKPAAIRERIPPSTPITEMPGIEPGRSKMGSSAGKTMVAVAPESRSRAVTGRSAWAAMAESLMVNDPGGHPRVSAGMRSRKKESGVWRREKERTSGTTK